MEVREMKNGNIEPVRFGCCRCSQMIPVGEPIAACQCCGRYYCVWCYVGAMLFWKEKPDRVDAALPETEERCVEDLFAAIDRVRLEEQLESNPVPPRARGQ
jgi:hypothetical protein